MDSNEVRALYQRLLESWNTRSAAGMAALFADDGSAIGFDGSAMNGPAEIESVLRGIFAHHPTAAYVTIVRSVRFVTPEVAILSATVGMVPPGQSDVNPAVNAIQTLVAAKHGGRWRIALFQNTPAAFHGRPELSETLTQELRAAAGRRARYPANPATVAALSRSAYPAWFPSCVHRQVTMLAAVPEKLNPAKHGVTLRPPLVYRVIQFSRLRSAP